MVAGKRIIQFSQDILQDLADFTGMSMGSIQPYFDQSECDHTRIELDKFVKPRNREELVFYYRCCRSEFVHNATKYWNTGKGWPLLDECIKSGASVLDYGAGTGQNCFYIYEQLKAVPNYFEISILQKEFFKFRSLKKWNEQKINIIEPYKDNKFDPIYSIQGCFDVIMMSQVLEHIPEPKELLIHLISRINEKGMLLEDSPFESHNFNGLDSWTKEQFEEFMKKAGMEKLRHGVWRKEP